MAETCDVVIVGARLAGSCAAAHLARAGHRVVVLDKSRFPSDQLSTHLLFPSGVDELRRMGALDGILAGDPARSPWLGLQIGDRVRLLERWRACGPIDYCICVPRPQQDLELVRAARAAGADVREHCRVTAVTWRGGRAAGVRYTDADGTERELAAQLVVGADGRRSTVAGLVGAARPYRASRNGRGLVFRYADDPRAGTRDGETIWQWRDGDSLGFVFPSAPRGRILMLFMGAAGEVTEARADPEGHWARKIAMHPGMAARTWGAGNLTKIRTCNDTSAYFRASSGPGWALAGDAGHFKDPVIGQGQRDALWSGRRLAELAGPVLDDPARLDISLRGWEQERDLECLHSYHFGNVETVVRPVIPVLTEILRRMSGTTAPSAGDLFGRARTLPEIISLPRIALGLADALRHDAGRDPAGLTRDALAELKIHLEVRRERRARRFRSTRLVPGSDHPNPEPPGHAGESRRDRHNLEVVVSA
ncbi:hypothetical protein GCM10023321_20780 [Pseudonocardia eucalypti]|uniref:FAD-binding domain-containing protein n=1 Tax=Pseudonocardia eucalypti TaxID=648755 RepID=A0ABP9PUA8_9PSEU